MTDEDRTTGSLSWALQLQRYTQGSPCTDPALLAQRKALIDNVQANQNNAEAWADFLQNEEAIEAQKVGTSDRAPKANLGLAQLYNRAIELVPRARGHASDAYMRLWVGHAKYQWYRNEDEGRDLFKAMKNQHLGDMCALLYCQWANLEHQAGNTSKGLSIVQKGLKERAEPRSMLEQLQSSLVGAGVDRDASSVERKVHFQEDHTATAAAGLQSSAGGVPSARRPLPSTPGIHLKVHDASCSTAPYTQLSAGSSSASKSSTTLLPTDLSLVLSAQTSMLPTKSQTSCQSQGSEDDTINCRSTDDNRTHGSFGGVSVSRATGGGGNTGTVTLPAGIGGSLNLAAGAAALAALGAGGSSVSAGGGGGGSSGGGNNTGNVSLGLKRFGLKSKAVRMVGDKPVTQPHGASPEAEQLNAGSKDAAAGAQRMALTAGINLSHADTVPAHIPLEHPSVGRHDSVAQRLQDAAPPAQPQQGFDEAQEALSRKRRAGMEPAQSPSRLVASVVLQDEYPKRRQSPDTNVAGATGAGAAGSSRGVASDLGERRQPPTGSNESGAGGMSMLTAARNHERASNSSGAPVQVANGRGAVPAGTDLASATPANSWLAPLPTPATAPQVASAPFASAARHLPVQQPGALLGTQGIGHAAAMSVDRQLATPGPSSSSRHAAACADENMAPMDICEPGPAIDENQAPAVPPAPSVSMGTTVKSYKMPAAAALATPSAVSQPQQQSMDGREPLRPMGHAAARPSPAPAPVAPTPRSVPQQQPLPSQPQARAAATPSASQIGGFSWPERLEQPQARPIESEMYVYVHGIRYQKLDLAGKGGSSKVYKVLGLNRGIYALKRVRFQNKDQEAVKGFIDEISLLRQLRGKPNIIQLIDAQVFRDDGLVYMVLEYGDIDLARLLQSHEEARRRAIDGRSGDAAGASTGASVGAGGGGAQEIDANFIRLYWQQMLQAVKCIHDARIVHADLKPANFMLVQGQLKLIDFGIAKAIQGDTTSINRESQVGTLNYMSPEAIQGGSQNPLGGPPLKVGRPSDVWSLGCILYQMIYGRTPFADLAFIPKMNAICNPAHQVPLPECGEPDAVDVIRRCLDRDPKTRISLQDLLDHHFLHPNRRKAQQPAPVPQQHSYSGAPGAGLTEEQIKTILQLGVAGGGGVADLDSVARRVLMQLSQGGLSSGQAGGAGAHVLAQPPSQPSVPRCAPPPPPPPLPPVMCAPSRAPAPPPAPPPPPPPMPPRQKATAMSAQGAPPAAAAQRPAAPGNMGDLAAMAAAAAARRAAKPLVDPMDQQSRPAAASRPPPPGAVGAAGLPLLGAELHAAILQQRAQLRPVQDASQQAQQQQAPVAVAHGDAGSRQTVPGAQRAQAQQQGPPAQSEKGLEAVLRRGLERFHLGDADAGGDTHGHTDFIQAAMTAAKREG